MDDSWLSTVWTYIWDHREEGFQTKTKGRNDLSNSQVNGVVIKCDTSK